MTNHETAYHSAYPVVYADRAVLMTRREYRTGSVFQRCEARHGCPSVVDGARPKHRCRARWFGSIEAGYTASGSRRRITVSAKTREAAKRRLRDKQAEIDAQGRQNVRRTTTVARWSEKWLEQVQTRVRPSAYEADRAAMRWVVQTIGTVKLTDVTPEDVTSVAAKLRSQGKSTSTALRYHGALMRMLKAAALAGYTIAPNVLLVDAPIPAVNDRQAIPLPQTTAILGHVVGRPAGSRWALAFLQGLRQAETLGLTWPQVDLDAGTLTISWQVKSLRYVDRHDPSRGFLMPDGYEARHLVGSTHLVRPKSKAGWRVQPLVPWVVNALSAWREVAPENPHDLIWPGRVQRGKTWPRNPASDRDEFVTIQSELGIAHPSGRPYHVHEIRHGTATLLMRLGVAESVRIAIMGHSSIAVTQGYEYVDLAEARRALEAAATELGLVTPTG